jgi:hypothetical protein
VTVTKNEQELELPAPSIATQLTVFTPGLKVETPLMAEHCWEAMPERSEDVGSVNVKSVSGTPPAAATVMSAGHVITGKTVSTIVTENTHEDVSNEYAVVTHDTHVVPRVKYDPDVTLQMVDLIPEPSVAFKPLAEYETLVLAILVLTSSMIFGQVRLGGTVELTVTLKEQLEESVPIEVATQVTVVVPMENQAPDLGEQVSELMPTGSTADTV